MPDYVVAHALGEAKGLFLLGAFLTRAYKTGRTPAGRPQAALPDLQPIPLYLSA